MPDSKRSIGAGSSSMSQCDFVALTIEKFSMCLINLWGHLMKEDVARSCSGAMNSSRNSHLHL